MHITYGVSFRKKFREEIFLLINIHKLIKKCIIFVTLNKDIKMLV